MPILATMLLVFISGQLLHRPFRILQAEVDTAEPIYLLFRLCLLLKIYMTSIQNPFSQTPGCCFNAKKPSSYLAPTPLLADAGFFTDNDESLTPNAPLLINLLLFKYASTSFSTLPLSCFGFLHPPLISPEFPPNAPTGGKPLGGTEQHTAYNTTCPSLPSSPPSSPPQSP